MEMAFKIIFMTIFILSMALGSFSKSPMVSAMGLSLTSIILSFLVGSKMSHWFCYALIMVLVGGMMILFTYLCCLAQSNKFMSSWKSAELLFLLGSALFSYFFMDTLSTKCSVSHPFYSMKMEIFIQSYQLLIYLISGLYLITVLLSCVMICQKEKGALKSLLYNE